MSWFSRLRVSRRELEQADLRELVRDLDATPVREVRVRHRATVAGAVVALTFPPRGTAPRVIARLDDGTGTIGLIFLGRDQVPGVEPGRRMTATGMVAELDGVLVMHNPDYTLLTGINE